MCNTCLNCGSSNTIIKPGTYHFVESGLKYVVLKNVPFRICNECGEKTLLLPAHEELMRVIGEAVIFFNRKLTGAEVRFLRKNMFLTKEEFSKIIGVRKKTVEKWETGDSSLKFTEDRVIRMVYAQMMKLSPLKRKKLVEMFRFETPFRKIDLPADMSCLVSTKLPYQVCLQAQ